MVEVADILKFVDAVTAKFKPQRIVLFGSYAYGTPTEDSDVDLLVVMEFEGPAFEQRVKICRALTGISVPVEIIVTSPEDFAWRKDIVGTIEYPATHEGKVWYARTYSDHC